MPTTHVRATVDRPTTQTTKHLYNRPKWQYRLLVGSLLFLLFALIFMTTITIIYGFGMTFVCIYIIYLHMYIIHIYIRI